MSSSSSSLFGSSSTDTQSSIIESSPPAVREAKQQFWESLANYHKRKRNAERAAQEADEEEGRLKRASASKIELKTEGGETTQDGDKEPAAESLAIESAAQFPPRFVQPNETEAKQSASKRTWVKTRASARIAVSRRANASATSGDKAKKPEVEPATILPTVSLAIIPVFPITLKRIKCGLLLEG